MSTSPLILSDDLIRNLSKVHVDDKIKFDEEVITPDNVMIGSVIASGGLFGTAVAFSCPPLALAGTSIYFGGVVGSLIYKSFFQDSKSRMINSIKDCIINAAKTAKNWTVLGSAVISNVIGSYALVTGSFFSVFMITLDVPILMILAYQGIPLKPLVSQMLNTLGLSGLVISGGLGLIAYSLAANLFLDDEFKLKAEFFDKSYLN